jgi:hypothetical protein
MRSTKNCHGIDQSIAIDALDMPAFRQYHGPVTALTSSLFSEFLWTENWLTDWLQWLVEHSLLILLSFTALNWTWLIWELDRYFSRYVTHREICSIFADDLNLHHMLSSLLNIPTGLGDVILFEWTVCAGWGHAIAQAVSCCVLTAAAWVQDWVL